jgi:hypothetical protein
MQPAVAMTPNREVGVDARLARGWLRYRARVISWNGGAGLSTRYSGRDGERCLRIRPSWSAHAMIVVDSVAQKGNQSTCSLLCTRVAFCCRSISSKYQLVLGTNAIRLMNQTTVTVRLAWVTARHQIWSPMSIFMIAKWFVVHSAPSRCLLQSVHFGSILRSTPSVEA